MSSTRANKRVGERDFLRPVHLGLDDVNRASPAVAVGPIALEVMERDQAGEYGVENAFGRFPVLAVQYRRVGHQVTDIAVEHE